MLTFCHFEKHFMTGTALHTNEILQYCYWIRLYSHLLQKNLIKFVLNSTRLSVINVRICDVLLNFFVSVYNGKKYKGHSLTTLTFK